MNSPNMDLSRFQDIEHLVILRVFDQNENLLAVLPNLSTDRDALRIFHGHQDRNGKITAEGAKKCLNALAKGGLDQGNRIAELLNRLNGQDGYNLVAVASPQPNLLDRLAVQAGIEKDLDAFLELLNAGDIRAAEKEGDVWTPQPYVINGILNYFKIMGNMTFPGGWWDKIPLKTTGFGKKEFQAGGVRYAPGCQVRTGCYIGPGTVIMNQAFINIGAYIAGDGVMVDVASRLASCAQIGKNVKFGAGSGIEGVLEPAGRLPSIVEDNVKIGAMCEISGIVQEGAVIASGVVMASGKKIFDEATGEIVPPLPLTVGETTYLLPIIPSYRLAVGGTLLAEKGNYATDAIILKPGDLRDRDTLKHFEKQGVLYQ